MKSRLILIEGLPGSGKTTFAKLVNEILNDFKIDNKVFFEGDLDHPADYDGVAYLNEGNFRALLNTNETLKDIIEQNLIVKNDHYLISYMKMNRKYGSKIPREFIHSLLPNDIYELPFQKNKELIIDKWKQFYEDALRTDTTYIFECNFIQNPATIGMIKYNSPNEKVIDYVKKLESIIKDLNPLLIYITTDDVGITFNKAIKERPNDWSQGFIEYYTKQGYGLFHRLEGTEGTIQVLEARKELELDILKHLSIDKEIIDNTKLDINKTKQELTRILEKYILRSL